MNSLATASGTVQFYGTEQFESISRFVTNLATKVVKFKKSGGFKPHNPYVDKFTSLRAHGSRLPSAFDSIPVNISAHELIKQVDRLTQIRTSGVLGRERIYGYGHGLSNAALVPVVSTRTAKTNPNNFVVDKPLVFKRSSEGQLLIHRSDSFETSREVDPCACKRSVRLDFDQSNIVRESEQLQGSPESFSKTSFQTQVLRNYRAN